MGLKLSRTSISSSSPSSLLSSLDESRDTSHGSPPLLLHSAPLLYLTVNLPLLVSLLPLLILLLLLFFYGEPTHRLARRVLQDRRLDGSVTHQPEGTNGKPG